MVNYKNGIIYRIYDNTNGDVYYGSTANVLRYRMGKHKSEAKEYKSKCKSKSIILNDDYVYSEVEKYPCNSKKELHTRERYYIENFTCVNKVVPTRTQKEWNEDNDYWNKYHTKNREHINKTKKLYRDKNKQLISEYSKKYYETHKEEMNEYQSKYREDHKEEQKERQNQYRQDHKEELNEKSKKYYYDNQERLTEKHICSCGGKYTNNNKSTHFKSKKHQKYITDNTIVCIECK